MLHLFASSVVANVLQQGLLSTPSVSLTHCASRCMSDGSCSSFFYHRQYQHCYLSSLVYNTASSRMKTYVGVTYYKWKHSACRRGYTYSRGAHLCYKPGPTAEWKQARALCRKKRSRLVKIDTPEKQAAMSYFVKTSGNIWIGLRLSNKGFRWTDKSPLRYTSWYPGQPVSLSVSKLKCVVNYSRDGKPVAWHLGKCFFTYRYMCEIPLPSREIR